ncbi:MAG: tetratricopeptide repeat protein [Prochlorotrichaceae cyanobacterium]|jgi:tetratricopeptide (TPR) repeat protein
MQHLKIIAQAIDRGDYAQALASLKVFLQQNPEDPWGKFYLGRLQEAQHHLRPAEDLYSQVLKETTQVKLINLARQGIQRVKNQEQQAHQEAIAAAMSEAGQQAMGCLVLEPMDNLQKSKVVPEFARLMHLEPYTARLHLPTRIWRLYRTGALGELTVYQRSLQNIGVAAFCVSLRTIESIPIFQIKALEVIGEMIRFNGYRSDKNGEILELHFQDIQQWVEGLLPIFEQVVDQGPWRKVIHKEKIQDYAHLIDLHCPDRNLILRLCDRKYLFPSPKRSGTAREQLQTLTHRQRWTELITPLKQALPHVNKHSEFNLFAEAAFDQDLFLQKISPQIDLLRREDSPWDRAFHLYSILHWLSRDRGLPT